MTSLISEKRPLVLVDWLDSHIRAGWRDDHDEGQPAVCRSVGWLVAKDRRRITLVQSLANNGEAADSITIPRAAVTRMRTLR